MTRNPVSFDALRRLRDTRRRLQAAMYRARIDVLREQLRAARGTYWTGVAG